MVNKPLYPTGLLQTETCLFMPKGAILQCLDYNLFLYTQITLTLWGSDAENFEPPGNPVVALKSARISEFGGGKNLSTVSGTTFKVNPEMRECYRLRSWYDNEGENISTTNLSARSGAGNFNTPWMSFKEVQDQNLGNAERGKFGFFFINNITIIQQKLG